MQITETKYIVKIYKSRRKRKCFAFGRLRKKFKRQSTQSKVHTRLSPSRNRMCRIVQGHVIFNPYHNNNNNNNK